MKLLLSTFFFLTVFNTCGQTFQEALGEELRNKDFRKNQLPYLEYSNKGDEYFFYWHQSNEKYFLIFAQNQEIFFVLNCRSLPVGEDGLGSFSLFPKEHYESLPNSELLEATENVMDNFGITTEPMNTKVVTPKPYSGTLNYDGSFLPIVVEFELLVLYHYQNGTLIELPLDY